MHIHVGDVDDEFVWNVVCCCANFYAVNCRVNESAFLDNSFCCTGEVNWNRHDDFLREVNLHEVNVAYIALHWVALHVLHDCWVCLVSNLQFKNGVGACWARQRNAQVAAFNSDYHWLHACSVNDRRNVVGSAQTTSLWATERAANVGLQCGGHVQNSVLT